MYVFDRNEPYHDFFTVLSPRDISSTAVSCVKLSQVLRPECGRLVARMLRNIRYSLSRKLKPLVKESGH